MATPIGVSSKKPRGRRPRSVSAFALRSRIPPLTMGADDQVWRRRYQGEQAADQCRDRKGHHQLGAAETRLGHEAENYRDEDGDDAGRTHERAERGYDQHEQCD
jgi:hypothetical protein